MQITYEIYPLLSLTSVQQRNKYLKPILFLEKPASYITFKLNLNSLHVCFTDFKSYHFAPDNNYNKVTRA